MVCCSSVFIPLPSVTISSRSRARAKAHHNLREVQNITLPGYIDYTVFADDSQRSAKVRREIAIKGKVVGERREPAIDFPVLNFEHLLQQRLGDK